MKKTIRNYSVFFIIALLFLISSISYLLYQANNEAKSRIKTLFIEQQRLLAKQTALGIEENITLLERELQLLSKSTAIRKMDPEKTEAVLATALEQDRFLYIKNVGLIDSYGLLHFALRAPQQEEYIRSCLKKFENCRETSTPISVCEVLPIETNASEEKAILMAMPVFSREGQCNGLIFFTIIVNELIEAFIPPSTETCITCVLDEKGTPLFHSAKALGDKINTLFNTVPPLQFLPQKREGGDNDRVEYVSPEGIRLIAASVPLTIANQKWSIVLGADEKEVSRLWKDFIFKYIFGSTIAFLAIIGGSIFVLYLTHRWNFELHKEVEERKHAEEALKKAHEGLETRVEKRTAELQRANVQLKDEIDARKRVEKELLKQNELIKSTHESLTHPFYVINTEDYTIEMANSAANFGKLTAGSTCYALTHNRDEPCDGEHHPCTIKEVKKTGKPVVLEHIHYDPGGEAKTFAIYGYPIFDDSGNITQIIEYVLDVSAQKHLEEQLRQSQKMESVGRLAGGVAHDFNNILSAILGYSELTLRRMPVDDPLRKNISQIIEAGERAEVLTRKLLIFSRKQVLSIKVINLNSTVESIMKLLQRMIGEDVVLELNTKSSLRNIKADPGQIEQILMNLVVNARDAMACGGRLYIETSNVDLDAEYAQLHQGVKPGPYVMLEVSDTGTGMDPDVYEKIFEPFFTTKKQGTGLGLSIVYGIVKQHNGHIFVYSEEDMGTTFKIYFPATEDSRDPEPQKIEPTILKGTETILVVDDEHSIRNLIIDSIQPLGYKILDASCAEEALQLIETTKGHIDLLLTDIIMPGMKGDKLAEAIKERHPSIKVIFMSGYSDHFIADRGINGIGSAFIQKPLSLAPGKLANLLREVLDNE